MKPETGGTNAGTNANHPKVTVYIACHNYGQYVSEAIESVIRQTMTDWELLIIDDNSTDTSPEVIALYADRPEIRTFRTDGIGLPAVCNLALDNARGTYLVRLDGDDILDENALQVLSGYLDRSPEMGLVYPDYFLIDEFGGVFSQFHRQRDPNGNNKLDMPPNGACTMIRKQILLDCGGYRVDLGAQDGFDLWAKVRDHCRMGNVNLPLFKYRRHSRNLTNNSRRILNARRRIKRDAILDRIDAFRPIVAVIPCRRHFEFVEDLWRQELNGASLLERKLKSLIGCDLLDLIVVACDNPSVTDVLDKIDDDRVKFFERAPKNTARANPLPSILEEISENFDPDMKGTTLAAFCQAPFLTSSTIEEVITTLVFNEADTSYGLERLDSQLLRRTPHGLEPINRRSQLQTDGDVIYQESATCFATRNANLLAGEINGRLIANFELSSPENFFIGSEYELRLARLIASD